MKSAGEYTICSEAIGLSYWLAERLGESVDAQVGETLLDTVKRLRDFEAELDASLL